MVIVGGGGEGVEGSVGCDKLALSVVDGELLDLRPRESQRVGSRNRRRECDSWDRLGRPAAHPMCSFNISLPSQTPVFGLLTSTALEPATSCGLRARAS